MRRFLAVLAVASVAGCSNAADPLQVVKPSAAAPAEAPAPTAPPAGLVVPAGAGAAAVAVLAGGRRVAVGTREAILVLPTAGGPPESQIAVASPVRAVVARPDGGFLAVAGPRVVGPATSWDLPADGAGLTLLGDGAVAVALPSRGEVAVYESTGTLRRTIVTGGQPSAVAAVSGTPGRIGVLDAGQTSLTVYRSDTGAREEALRAGDGATSVVADERGRLIAVDTRDGELLVFSVGPLVLRQRFPAPGAPYGLAYDATKHLVWVTLTARNEVVGYDVSGGAPREVRRLVTVRQPDAVAVDGPTSTLVVAGRAEGVVQVSGA